MYFALTNEALAFTDFSQLFRPCTSKRLRKTAISQWWTENRELKSDNPEIEFAPFPERVEVISTARITPVRKDT